ncbi:unnamed protein product [Pleuronectes platessa]|uniref:Uncharacterized protein n=1 Tax=Pleuronectes platessa TaxID=8262 RepID=A0A9N7Y175_PLEPL|nr:unnamed protein product [Pleuronectes platessa]
MGSAPGGAGSALNATVTSMLLKAGQGHPSGVRDAVRSLSHSLAPHGVMAQKGHRINCVHQRPGWLSTGCEQAGGPGVKEGRPCQQVSLPRYIVEEHKERPEQQLYHREHERRKGEDEGGRERIEVKGEEETRKRRA